MKTYHILTPLLLVLLLVGAVHAEQKVDFSGHELHYIVLNTTEISAQVAQKYDIIRSGKRAFINLSVLRQTSDGYGQPVSADITAIERSLLGQMLKINLQEIREGSAIYYIGTFPIIDRETLWFDIDLTVDNGPSFDFSFPQKVWQE